MKQIGVMEDGVFTPFTNAEVEWEKEFDGRLSLRVTISRYDLDSNAGLWVIDEVLGRARRDLINAAMKRP